MAKHSTALKVEKKKVAADESRSREAARPDPDPGTATELDRVIHERMRLGIVSALAANESLTFNELKDLMKTSDGNLSVHARKLEEANYVVCNKYFDGRTPRTEFRLTLAGRRALEKYINHMEALIRAVKG